MGTVYPSSRILNLGATIAGLACEVELRDSWLFSGGAGSENPYEREVVERGWFQDLCIGDVGGLGVGCRIWEANCRVCYGEGRAGFCPWRP